MYGVEYVDGPTKQTRQISEHIKQSKHTVSPVCCGNREENVTTVDGDEDEAAGEGDEGCPSILGINAVTPTGYHQDWHVLVV